MTLTQMTKEKLNP